MIATDALQHAKETMFQFAETSESAHKVITEKLELIPRWSKAKQTFLYFFLDDYLRQLQPRESKRKFQKRLQRVINSDGYNEHLAQVCSRACKVFNQLIVETNRESPPATRAKNESRLLIDFHHAEAQQTKEAPSPYRNGATLIKGPEGGGMSAEEYEALLGRIPTEAGPLCIRSRPLASEGDSILEMPSTSQCRPACTQIYVDPRIQRLFASALRMGRAPEGFLTNGDLQALRQVASTLAAKFLPQPPLRIAPRPLTPTEPSTNPLSFEPPSPQHQSAAVAPIANRPATVFIIDPAFIHAVIQAARSLPLLLPSPSTPAASSQEQVEAESHSPEQDVAKYSDAKKDYESSKPPPPSFHMTLRSQS